MTREYKRFSNFLFDFLLPASCFLWAQAAASCFLLPASSGRRLLLPASCFLLLRRKCGQRWLWSWSWSWFVSSPGKIKVLQFLRKARGLKHSELVKVVKAKRDVGSELRSTPDAFAGENTGPGPGPRVLQGTRPGPAPPGAHEPPPTSDL
ncbi:uncharacterized protein V6R79_025480 [Siganus canaliculatus]